MAISSDPPSDSTPLITTHTHMPSGPWYTRLHYYLAINNLKFLFAILTTLLGLPFVQTSTRPSFIKTYPCHPRLKNRIFIPQSFDVKSNKKLPLYIDIHGGGFALMSPIVDDPLCFDLCNSCNIIVISLDYPKTPGSKFPAAVNALSDLVVAVLEDSTLPIDFGRVAIAGCSAGANLALGTCQDIRLIRKIKGLVAYYPPLDFSTEKHDKFALLAALPKQENGEAPAQMLPEGQMRMFTWGYVKEGQDLRDPRLSPRFAKRESLPGKICVVGCELDALCWEDEEFANRLAGREEDGEDLVWEKNGVRWEKILGEDHAFDNNAVAFGERKRRMKERGQEMRNDVVGWLFREVYS